MSVFTAVYNSLWRDMYTDDASDDAVTADDGAVSDASSEAGPEAGLGESDASNAVTLDLQAGDPSSSSEQDDALDANALCDAIRNSIHQLCSTPEWNSADIVTNVTGLVEEKTGCGFHCLTSAQWGEHLNRIQQKQQKMTEELDELRQRNDPAQLPPENTETIRSLEQQLERAKRETVNAQQQTDHIMTAFRLKRTQLEENLAEKDAFLAALAEKDSVIAQLNEHERILTRKHEAAVNESNQKVLSAVAQFRNESKIEIEALHVTFNEQLAKSERECEQLRSEREALKLQNAWLASEKQFLTTRVDRLLARVSELFVQKNPTIDEESDEDVDDEDVDDEESGDNVQVAVGRPRLSEIVAEWLSDWQAQPEWVLSVLVLVCAFVVGWSCTGPQRERRNDVALDCILMPVQCFFSAVDPFSGLPTVGLW